MKSLLKFITCGSVDDGKSTLIGHILYDSKLLYTDQEEALKLDSKVGSADGAIDYSLLLDGLTEEREQGITIDVAYRYFTTDARSFIVADTPGHEEYTRNMAVGASFADLAVILIDASKGVLTQTKRHARICDLMGIQYFVFCVNKMDLIDYSKSRFAAIIGQIDELAKELNLPHVEIIPVSATVGDNVTRRSDKMPWYKGEVLLDYLETVDIQSKNEEQGFYMPVQRVCRPNHHFRGFQGQIEAGTLTTGDEVISLPSHEKAHVKAILVGDAYKKKASVGQPVTIQLDREVDVSRGCVLQKAADLKIASQVKTTLLWMDDHPLTSGRPFFIKIGTRLIPGQVKRIISKIDINNGQEEEAKELLKNEIAHVIISFADAVVVDTLDHHKTLGELILIDRITNATSACGVVEDVFEDNRILENVTKKDRELLTGAKAITVVFDIDSEITLDLVKQVENQLYRAGLLTYLYRPQAQEDAVNVVRRLNDAGVIVLLVLNHQTRLTNDFSALEHYEALDLSAISSASEICQSIRKIAAADPEIAQYSDYI